jgi:predicted GTPase
MNDKIKQLLENAEQSDAIAINKWRIENREQLRKERKEKLKELMEKDKQQDIAELATREYPFSNGERNAFIAGYNKAREIEEKQKGYSLEQMMHCWNAALKFEPQGPNFIDYITSLKKENKKADEQQTTNGSGVVG